LRLKNELSLKQKILQHSSHFYP